MLCFQAVLLLMKRRGEGRRGGGREGGRENGSWSVSRGGLLWWPNATEGGREGGRRNEQARLGLCALPSFSWSSSASSSSSSSSYAFTLSSLI